MSVRANIRAYMRGWVCVRGVRVGESDRVWKCSVFAYNPVGAGPVSFDIQEMAENFVWHLQICKKLLRYISNSSEACLKNVYWNRKKGTCL